MSLTKTLLVLVVLIICGASAFAGGYQLNEHGARAMAMGGASVAQASDGSAIYFNPAVKPRKVIDPTGAGDSFRGGLISGLVKGLSMEQCAKIGSTCASFCLEYYGTQEYHFSQELFNERLQSCITK